MAEHFTVVKQTAATYIKGHEDMTRRGRLLMALLEEQGRIKTKAQGFSWTYNLKVRQRRLRSLGSGTRPVFESHDSDEQLTFGPRGCYQSDFMSELDKAMNSGPQAIVDRYAEIVPSLLQDFNDALPAELLCDGIADTERLLGIESFMGTTGTTTAADMIAQPGVSDYAGKATTLAALGGSWSATRAVKPNAQLAKDWPFGNGSSDYDANSPKLLNTTSTAWTGTAGWQGACEVILSHAGRWCNRLNGDDRGLFVHLLSDDLMQQFCDHFRVKQIELIPHKKAQDLGFDGVFNFEGTMVKSDFDVAPEIGYGINVNAMELFSVFDELLMTRGPEYDLKSLGYLFFLGLFGNLKCLPKFFAKYKAYA